jgi:dTDP-glucose 4,6-dehydratase
MRILVTGAAGFIGSNFVRYWLERHPDDHVVAYDLLTYAGNRESLPNDVPFVQGDIADDELAEQTLRDEGIETVVNFAAESHNSLAVVDPGRFFHTNVIGTQTMLEAARRTEVGRFHHVSTCEVYGDLPLDSDEVFTEETPYRPRTPYNASKAGADHAVRAYFETYELPVTITNCSNNYGPESLKTIVPDRPGHDRRYLLDSTKLREELGWREEIGWEDGIAETVRWYADNRDWWEPLRDRAPVDESAWSKAR